MIQKCANANRKTSLKFFFFKLGIKGKIGKPHCFVTHVIQSFVSEGGKRVKCCTTAVGSNQLNMQQSTREGYKQIC